MRKALDQSGLTRTVAWVSTAVLGVAAVGGMPASAQEPSAQPTLVSAERCYSLSLPTDVTGQGWTPNGDVRLVGRYVEGGRGAAVDQTLRADAQGRISFESGVPGSPATRRRVQLTAEDLTRAAAGAPPEQRQATVTFWLSWAGPFYARWNTSGAARGRPGRVGTIEASGYLGWRVVASGPNPVLFAHYYHSRSDRFVATTRVGRLRGACRSLKLRFREFAFRPVPRGTYSVYFDEFPFTSDLTFDSPGFRRVVVR
jgi:hypothetical protein